VKIDEWGITITKKYLWKGQERKIKETCPGSGFSPSTSKSIKYISSIYLNTAKHVAGCPYNLSSTLTGKLCKYS
jgi:hypothetical protein